MYIDPRTEFRYDNDEQQAKWTMLALAIASIVFCTWMVMIVKNVGPLG